MPRDNAHVLEIKAHLDNEFETGFWQGIEANPNHAPSYWLSKPVGNLTARERGDLLGRLVRDVERDNP